MGCCRLGSPRHSPIVDTYADPAFQSISNIYDSRCGVIQFKALLLLSKFPQYPLTAAQYFYSLW